MADDAWVRARWDESWVRAGLWREDKLGAGDCAMSTVEVCRLRLLSKQSCLSTAKTTWG